MSSEAAIMKLTDRTESEAANLVLLQARGGDAEAFADLLRDHERLVFGTARRLLGAVEDAEDAAQEVFLRLHRHLDRLDPSRPVGAWLYRVTVNVCHTLSRRSRSRPTVPLGDEEDSIQDTGTDPATAAELQEEQRMVAEGLETLPRKERAALVLHDLEELSTREVADALGVSEVTVRTHLCRARQKMRTFRERWYRRSP
jgi:RNA polymerase sigma-70 factor (ECF subfamily)